VPCLRYWLTRADRRALRPRESTPTGSKSRLCPAAAMLYGFATFLFEDNRASDSEFFEKVAVRWMQLKGFRDDLLADRRGDVRALSRRPSWIPCAGGTKPGSSAPPATLSEGTFGCSYRETFPKRNCVVAHGDIELVFNLTRKPVVTRCFATIRKLFWSSYYCWFGKYLAPIATTSCCHSVSWRRCREF